MAEIMKFCKRCGGSGVALRWPDGMIPRGSSKSHLVPCPDCEAGRKIPVVTEININEEESNGRL